MESFNDALVACVKALGGSKVVGPMLYPEKMVDAAQRALLDALNPERPNRLAAEQVLLIMRKARQAGFHDAADWMLRDLGYQPPVPAAPKDEMADLMRSFIEATKRQEETAANLQKMQSAMQVLLTGHREAA